MITLPPPILQSLKEHTLDLHEQVDSKRMFSRLLSPDVTIEQFEETLLLFKAWIIHLSQSVQTAQLDSTHPIVDCLMQRRQWLGLASSCYSERTSIDADRVHSPCFWDGVYYVVEGSAMGGMRIAKHLRQTLDPVPPTVRYFETHGKGTMAHWQTVMEYLDQALITPEAQTDARAGARYGFECLINPTCD